MIFARYNKGNPKPFPHDYRATCALRMKIKKYSILPRGVKTGGRGLPKGNASTGRCRADVADGSLSDLSSYGAYHCISSLYHPSGFILLSAQKICSSVFLPVLKQQLTVPLYLSLSIIHPRFSSFFQTCFLFDHQLFLQFDHA